MKRNKKEKKVKVKVKPVRISRRERKRLRMLSEDQANMVACYNFHKAFLTNKLDREVENYEEIMARLRALDYAYIAEAEETVEEAEQILEAAEAAKAEEAAEKEADQA